MAGVFGGIAATLVLSGLREAWTRFGLVFETAPMQVVNRMQELGLVKGSSHEERRDLTLAAHFAQAGEAVASILSDPEKSMREDLQNFEKIVERGELGGPGAQSPSR